MQALLLLKLMYYRDRKKVKGQKRPDGTVDVIVYGGAFEISPHRFETLLVGFSTIFNRAERVSAGGISRGSVVFEKDCYNLSSFPYANF